MKKILIAKVAFDTFVGQNFNSVKSITIDDDKEDIFMDMINELGYIALVIGDYNEIETLFPSDYYYASGEMYHRKVTYPKYTLSEFMQDIIDSENEFSEQKINDAKIIREYMCKTNVLKE